MTSEKPKILIISDNSTFFELSHTLPKHPHLILLKANHQIELPVADILFVVTSQYNPPFDFEASFRINLKRIKLLDEPEFLKKLDKRNYREIWLYGTKGTGKKIKELLLRWVKKEVWKILTRKEEP